EFNYRFQSNRLGRVFLGIETSGPDDNIKQLLADTGHSLIDLTNDECAKIHVRHMIGGTPGKKIENECTYRFQFPERPGALLEFLKALQNKWSITMFHYRNHGAAYGRVLVGFDVPYSDVSSFNQLIEQLPIQTFNETNNPAIRYFLN
ncbi:MAG: threonine ammonia-lyase, biosynthetic, partial [Candidatus Margulisbacteria bacterium]|nr:threonine ammonia-lyase, biosynthetic [Candidatus Margulisiibacteriota bacterium]